MRTRKLGLAVATVAVAVAVIATRASLPSGTLPEVHAQETESKTCSLSTLRGGYGISFHGLGTSGPVPAPINAFIPVAGVGLVTFDGNGNFSLAETVSFGGQILPLTVPGTYSVNPDCTGALQAQNAAHLNFVVVHNGQESLAVNTDQGRVAIDNLEKQ